MRGKFGIASLIFSSISFAAPVSTPNQLSDTPIIAGGGSGGNLSMNNCRAYQTDNAAIRLSGGETLVFYGGGGRKSGGYLATKTTYSGTAYVKLSKRCERAWYYGSIYWVCPHIDGTAIGLFARNSEDQRDFIAGVGGGFAGSSSGYGGSYIPLPGYSFNYSTCSPASGGGWVGEPAHCTRTFTSTSMAWPHQVVVRTDSYMGIGGSSSGWSFHSYLRSYYGFYSSAGFSGSDSGGGASSISAWYNHYTRDYTLPTTSATITGGGITGQGRLYVCQ